MALVQTKLVTVVQVKSHSLPFSSLQIQEYSKRFLCQPQQACHRKLSVVLYIQTCTDHVMSCSKLEYFRHLIFIPVHGSFSYNTLMTWIV